MCTATFTQMFWLKKVLVVLLFYVMTGLHDQFLEEAQQHEQEEVAMRDQLVDTAKELTQLSNHIAALEQAIEAERTSHIQTKFRCELFQVHGDAILCR